MRITELAPLAVVALIVTVSIAEDPVLAINDAPDMPESVPVQIHGERVPCLGERAPGVT